MHLAGKATHERISNGGPQLRRQPQSGGGFAVREALRRTGASPIRLYLSA